MPSIFRQRICLEPDRTSHRSPLCLRRNMATTLSQHQPSPQILQALQQLESQQTWQIEAPGLDRHGEFSEWTDAMASGSGLS